MFSISTVGILIILLMPLIDAVALHGTCTNNQECDGSMAECRDKTCQCIAPFYTPCNTTCEVNGRIVYEGNECAVSGNCIENAECQEKKCRCKDGFTSKNGACFKNLFTACENPTECWSEYCLGLRCLCPPGFTSNDNATTCQRKLVNVYSDWNEANEANAFCQDREFCFDIIAECYNDAAHPETKFCKCPTGYDIKTDNNRPRCDARVGQNLSPLNVKPSTYDVCGRCADDHAACIKVSEQQTCWCRAGYEKSGDKCESRSKSGIVFPNAVDVSTHDFTTSCSQNQPGVNQISNGLCSCAPGYEFDVLSRSCRKIILEWDSDVNEYGLCTQINSADQPKAENNVCPEPLKCEVRNDRYVCSCGIDQFRDLINSSQCVYYIGKGANKANSNCPTNAAKNAAGNCECNVGYQVVYNNRLCKLNLSLNILDGSCTANLTNNTMCQGFGIKAVLCNTGECRCPGNDSLPNKERTRCEAPLEKPLSAQREECPSYSTFQNNRCTCSSGFRPSSDLRECVRFNALLIPRQGPSGNSNGTLTTADCQAIFDGSVEVYENDQCQCRANALINDNKDGCLFQLNVDLQFVEDVAFCPSDSTTGGGLKCLCDPGFKGQDDRCVKITNRVYNDNDSTAPNITGVNNAVCTKLFGTGSIKSSNGDYCICRPIAYPVNSFTNCHFRINYTSPEIKTSAVCPANTNSFPLTSPTECVCKPGYHASNNNATCELTNVDLVGTENLSNAGACSRFTDDDCTAKYGANAFCKDDKCYCNRRLSFINSNKQCESLSNYKFPSEHDLYLHACTSDDDCGEKPNVICDYLNGNSGYKVCQCQPGLFLNPRSGTCESRCNNCDENANFECQNYVCRCKSGYVSNGPNCVPDSSKLELYQRCNGTSSYADQSLVCDRECDHAQCQVGYRPETNSQCVQYRLQNDRCLNQDSNICKTIDTNAVCSRDQNQCLCKPSYYVYENKCARAVGFDCSKDNQCGPGECKANRCVCKGGQRVEETTDSNNRPLQFCINGIGQLRANSVFLCLLFFVWARVFSH